MAYRFYKYLNDFRNSAIVCYTNAPETLRDNLVTRGWFEPLEIEQVALS